MEKPVTLRPQRHIEPYPMASVTGAITNNVNWNLCERTAVACAALAARLRKSSQEIGKEVGVQRESTGQQRLWLPEFPEESSQQPSREAGESRFTGPPPGLRDQGAEIPKPKVTGILTRMPLLKTSGHVAEM